MIRAVIFDLEGTLLQIEALEALSFGYAATKLRPELGETEVASFCEALSDHSPRAVAVALLSRFGLERAVRDRACRPVAHRPVTRTPWQILLNLKLRAFDRALSESATVLTHSYPRNALLARKLRRASRKTAVISGFSWRQARRPLAALGLDDVFDFVAVREDAKKGPPDPELHLLAAKELGVPPAACLAIEGAPAGVEAALSARMSVVAFTTPLTRRRFEGTHLLERCWTVDGSDALCAVIGKPESAEARRARE